MMAAIKWKKVKMLLELRENEKGLFVKLIIQPRASKNELKGVQGDALKLRLTSPPVDGAANLACRTFLAKLVKIPPSQVIITAGLTSRHKTVFLPGISKDKFLETIKMHI